MAKKFALMLMVDEIETDSGFELMKQLEPVITELSKYGNVEGGLMEL